jgi:hypothetical protein
MKTEILSNSRCRLPYYTHSALTRRMGLSYSGQYFSLIIVQRHDSDYRDVRDLAERTCERMSVDASRTAADSFGVVAKRHEGRSSLSAFTIWQSGDKPGVWGPGADRSGHERMEKRGVCRRGTASALCLQVAKDAQY